MDVDVLLSDEFVEFSKKIAEIHTKKKEKTEELKKMYSQFQTEIKKLDDEAAKLAKDWESKSTKETSSNRSSKVI